MIQFIINMQEYIALNLHNTLNWHTKYRINMKLKYGNLPKHPLVYSVAANRHHYPTV